MDSSNVGFSLDFLNQENLNDPIYFHCFKKFMIFHFLLLMLLISLLRTVLTNPGLLEKEYVKIIWNFILETKNFLIL